MKQISILGGKAMIVELPEGATNPIVDDYLLGYNLPPPEWAAGWGDESYDTINLPPGTWQIVGMLSEVTEKTLSTVLDSTELNEGKRLYNIHGEPYPNRLTDSTLESLESAILAEGYSFTNIEINPDDFKAGTFSSGEHQRLRDRFEAAQSRVLSRERCLLLRRES